MVHNTHSVPHTPRPHSHDTRGECGCRAPVDALGRSSPREVTPAATGVRRSAVVGESTGMMMQQRPTRLRLGH